MCGFDHSTIDLVMDVKHMSAKVAAEWLASIWTASGNIQQGYQVSERMRRAGRTVKPLYEWSKLKPKHLKKREKGYVERMIASRAWRALRPPTSKAMLTLLTLTDPKTLTVTISTKDLASRVGIRRSAVIRAMREIECLGMYASEKAYDKAARKNKTTTYG